ncbi:TatD family hydrolase [Paenibacillus radicis (ex Gao et al. 2016)]|uniref:TatD-related deoxyribonuclease n=1 Tax=Paenibacillus radicis (ex Gao et al. 2016) TaxID=1737354 RepID=A0A917HLQ4_9BACL|nr:TatD family hydrolase [Paenibacillus radicis (ex Gao et al. 2016)]GGG83434.1 TatD-related deoxyribonuclease [Paenibacillus radicis (ex Gao et al. 2016)]
MAHSIGIDAHIHLDSYPAEEQQPLLNRAIASGIEAVIAVSMHKASSVANRELAIRNPDVVHPAYGFHPEQPLPEAAELDALFAWIRERDEEDEAFAIGEVGLPYYSRTGSEEEGKPFDEAPYLALLDRFAALAAELDRPLILHAVYEDAAKAIDIIERHGVRRAHFHWFKGDDATITRMIASGYYVSVTPDVGYEEEIQSLVRHYPLELLMAETDGPWPFEGEHAGKQTEPAMIASVAKEIAAIKGLTVEETVRTLRDNTRRFYGLAVSESAE